MLFENASQFQKAKQTLLENNRDIDLTASILKKSPLFSNLSEGEIISNLLELNEGLGDNILNFLSGAFGGDVSKLKTVLTQMKEQELKFNREEYEIYNEFYRILQDQKALDRDKNNPNYYQLSRDLQNARNALNVRMKELTKAHNDIFSALEERVRDLTKDSNRKKKYFNAQRATDVLETKNDRYNKIKSVTAMSSARTQDLEDFFNFKVSDVEKEQQEAKKKAEEEVERLRKAQATKSESTEGMSMEQRVEKLEEKFDRIIRTPGTPTVKKQALFNLSNEIYEINMKNMDTKTNDNPFGDMGEKSSNDLLELSKKIEKAMNDIDSVAKKTTRTTSSRK